MSKENTKEIETSQISQTEEINKSKEIKQESESENVKKARKLIGSIHRIKVKDGREFVGHLDCFDQQGNIVLSSSIEQTILNGEALRRRIGTITIGYTQIVEIFKYKNKKENDL
ncbi:hypothetical protein M0813_16915 [Anaeramoeba flamelloides]|uniref:Sm domain-containing protein n=1 Tax=Anaeramoeba flamelloides TaxID=1746091 RepID=A0ABQ8YY60_9EUKA|nr:hypothetical protein M0813_16915 [Anaeramoeba flamelloides]